MSVVTKIDCTLIYQQNNQKWTFKKVAACIGGIIVGGAIAGTFLSVANNSAALTPFNTSFALSGNATFLASENINQKTMHSVEQNFSLPSLSMIKAEGFIAQTEPLTPRQIQHYRVPKELKNTKFCGPKRAFRVSGEGSCYQRLDKGDFYIKLTSQSWGRVALNKQGQKILIHPNANDIKTAVKQGIPILLNDKGYAEHNLSLYTAKEKQIVVDDELVSLIACGKKIALVTPDFYRVLQHDLIIKNRNIKKVSEKLKNNPKVVDQFFKEIMGYTVSLSKGQYARITAIVQSLQNAGGKISKYCLARMFDETPMNSDGKIYLPGVYQGWNSGVRLNTLIHEALHDEKIDLSDFISPPWSSLKRAMRYYQKFFQCKSAFLKKMDSASRDLFIEGMQYYHDQKIEMWPDASSIWCTFSAERKIDFFLKDAEFVTRLIEFVLKQKKAAT